MNNIFDSGIFGNRLLSVLSQDINIGQVSIYSQVRMIKNSIPYLLYPT